MLPQYDNRWDGILPEYRSIKMTTVYNMHVHVQVCKHVHKRACMKQSDENLVFVELVCCMYMV